MASDYDGFGDVINGTTGIFDEQGAALESGLKKHDSVQAKATREGLALSVNMPCCGRPRQFLVDWPEIVAMKYSVNPAVAFRNTNIVESPTSWQYRADEDAWRPNQKCPEHGFWLPIRLLRHEPEKFLAQARGRGLINSEAEAVVAQHCAKVAAAGQGMR